jgi:hypothetical protein
MCLKITDVAAGRVTQPGGPHSARGPRFGDLWRKLIARTFYIYVRTFQILSLIWV